MMIKIEDHSGESEKRDDVEQVSVLEGEISW
jgi:hypothetical protein